MTELEFYKSLGEKCKLLREKLDISPTTMAKKTGVSRSLLYEFETDGKKISAFRLNKIMATLGLSTIESEFDEKKTSDLPTNGASLKSLRSMLRTLLDRIDAGIDLVQQDADAYRQADLVRQAARQAEQQHQPEGDCLKQV
jgi:transcriptional regulator with XRE-family HTH domain